MVSLWAGIAAWLTPSILFLLINLTIAAIALISILATRKQQPQADTTSGHHPDSILHRVTSFNFNFASHESEPVDQARQPTRTSSLLHRVTSFRLSSHTLQHVPGQDHPAQTENVSPGPKAEPVSGSTDKRRITKAMSMKEKEEDQEEINRRRPSTVREGKTSSFGEDEEVDAKADDFINKFKQQLKLQRLDSLRRYRDMLHRGGTN